MEQQRTTRTKTKHDDEDDSVIEELTRVDPDQIISAVASFARENPHTALAAAAGIGFLLGGGMTPRVLGTVGLYVARRYFRQI
jgi:ElaB/YqjD/DUF883 family membrane-anchored ribosome-binding protein